VPITARTAEGRTRRPGLRRRHGANSGTAHAVARPRSSPQRGRRKGARSGPASVAVTARMHDRGANQRCEWAVGGGTPSATKSTPAKPQDVYEELDRRWQHHLVRNHTSTIMILHFEYQQPHIKDNDKTRARNLGWARQQKWHHRGQDGFPFSKPTLSCCYWSWYLGVSGSTVSSFF
jgi:hypothetical protein